MREEAGEEKSAGKGRAKTAPARLRERMWNDTQITKQLGIAYLIVQAPMGNRASSVRLAATVSNAGGLGCFSAHDLPASEIKTIAAEIRAQTQKPFALHLWVGKQGPATIEREQFIRMLSWFVPFYRELAISAPPLPRAIGEDYDVQVEAVLAAQPHVFSFAFGIPEARALDGAGVDAIVAVGFEAGGHAGSFLHTNERSLVGTLALLPQVVDAVKAPVIAAGGIADARGMLAALALGAQAARIGTAFLACEQSDAPAAHREELLSDAAKETALSRAITGRLARGLRNRLMDELTARVS